MDVFVVLKFCGVHSITVKIAAASMAILFSFRIIILSDFLHTPSPTHTKQIHSSQLAPTLPPLSSPHKHPPHPIPSPHSGQGGRAQGSRGRLPRRHHAVSARRPPGQGRPTHAGAGAGAAIISPFLEWIFLMLVCLLSSQKNDVNEDGPRVNICVYFRFKHQSMTPLFLSQVSFSA